MHDRTLHLCPLALLAALSCGPGSDEAPTDTDAAATTQGSTACTPGEAVACACTDGSTATQVCRDDGSGYEACACPGAADEGGLDGTGAASGSASSGGDGGVSEDGTGTSAASTDGAETAAVDDGSETSSGGDASSGGGQRGHAVSGHVSRAGDLAPSGDGIGDLYVMLLDACNGESILDVAIHENANLSGGGVAGYQFLDVPDGTYFLTGFLDDDLDAVAGAPLPDPGDMIYASGGGLTCIERVVDGGDVIDGDFSLNALYD